MRKVTGIILCSVVPAWFVLFVLQQCLLESGVLNTKDMAPFVGNETGTVSEYLLNVWHWDGMLVLLMVAGLPCLACGVLLLRSSRVHRAHENAA